MASKFILNNSAVLKVVNPFLIPFEEWERRRPTHEELLSFYKQHQHFAMGDVKTRRLAVIDDPYAAAVYQVQHGATDIESHIDDFLETDKNFAEWRRSMPTAIPKILSNYQLRHQSGNDYPEVSSIINDVGVCLPEGQYVYHGGLLSRCGANFFTTRPLSTSLCPQIGVRLAEKQFNALNAGCLQLTLLKVKDPKTKAYIFKNKNTNQGHEKEIVFAAGAQIYLRGSHLVTMKYRVCTPSGGTKNIPGYVIVGEIS
jgi:hypothetical protein